MQKVTEKAMPLQDMHHLWCEEEKDTLQIWGEKRINNAGEDLLSTKGMVHVVIVKIIRSLYT